MSSRRFFCVASVLVVAGCAGPVPLAPDAALGTDAAQAADAGLADAGAIPPTYRDDVWPILELRCQGCHFVTDNPPQIFDAEATHGRLVGGAAVAVDLMWIAPGEPDASYLLRKIEGTHLEVGGRGDRMPPPVAGGGLDERERAILRAWIAGGARLDG